MVACLLSAFEHLVIIYKLQRAPSLPHDDIFPEIYLYLFPVLALSPQTSRRLVEPADWGVHPGHPEYKRALKEFIKETSVLASLRHVNVIRVYGVAYDADGVPWRLLEPGDVSLEKVSCLGIRDVVCDAMKPCCVADSKPSPFRRTPALLALPLSQYMAEVKVSSGISVEEMAVMWFQLACGLQYRHGRRPCPLTHRSVKPSNIMVCLLFVFCQPYAGHCRSNLVWVLCTVLLLCF